MSATLGRVTAQLEQPMEPADTDLVELINANINPPTALSRDDVYIRTLYIVSDQINSYGGCFPADEHRHLTELLVDSPVMIGHRKDRLPIGRNFHATVTNRNSQSWVKAYFYWLKSAHGAENLRDNIDGGIYKECSLAFTYWLPECSVCGKDIRVCPHEPTSSHNNRRPCHFNYRQIERVLETSLVYRGAIPNTRVSKELATSLQDQSAETSVDLTNHVTIVREPDTDSALVAVGSVDSQFFLRLHQFDPIRFRRGVRFLGEMSCESGDIARKCARLPQLLSGKVTDITVTGDKSLVIALESDWARQIVIKRLRVNKCDRFLVHCVETER